MNILYCGDASVRNGVLLSALSLAQHQAPLHLYLFTAALTVKGERKAALTPAAAAELQTALQEADPRNTVQLFDLTTLVNQAPPKANWNTCFTPYCMLRLYADLVPDLPDRLLYLDADVLALKPMKAFYEQPMTTTECVGVLDHYGQWFFHQRLGRDYVNSGVLLLNLALIRQTGLFAACRQRCATQRMFMPDQSALNKLAQGKRLAPRRFNDQHGPHADTVLMHFSTRLSFWPWFHPVTVKPWQVEAARTLLGAATPTALYRQYEAILATRKG